LDNLLFLRKVAFELHYIAHIGEGKNSGNKEHSTIMRRPKHKMENYNELKLKGYGLGYRLVRVLLLR
jgi:hypothetical protein